MPKSQNEINLAAIQTRQNVIKTIAIKKHNMPDYFANELLQLEEDERYLKIKITQEKLKNHSERQLKLLRLGNDIKHEKAPSINTYHTCPYCKKMPTRSGKCFACLGQNLDKLKKEEDASKENST